MAGSPETWEREWCEPFRRLRIAGRLAEARAILDAAQLRGDPLARLEAALNSDVSGLTFAEADAVVSEVEAVASPEDHELHFRLHSAYERRIGKGEPGEHAMRAFIHLLQAAKHSNNPMDMHAVGMHFEIGSIATPIDLSLAIEWYEKSASFGYSEAVLSLRRTRRKKVRSEGEH